ncbi:MAG: sigma-70 family RNA polymerase sigma factor [Armatimonadota bacterium]|nr:MAG: sigma-70 family RNA polymerase sigma factor [Armatimonadota bacterium]
MHEALAGEALLIERCQNGDAVAFDRLVEQHGQWVYNLAYRMIGDRDEAQDVAQEAFVRAFRAIKKFRRGSSFSTWLYRVTTNACLDEIKRRRRRPAPESALMSEDDRPPDPPDPGPDAAEEVEAIERRELIRRAIASLPVHYRLTLVLYELQGCSYDEVATITKTNVGTVKSRLNRARLALRQVLEPHLELLRGG